MCSLALTMHQALSQAFHMHIVKYEVAVTVFSILKVRKLRHREPSQLIIRVVFWAMTSFIPFSREMETWEKGLGCEDQHSWV